LREGKLQFKAKCVHTTHSHYISCLGEHCMHAYSRLALCTLFWCNEVQKRGFCVLVPLSLLLTFPDNSTIQFFYLNLCALLVPWSKWFYKSVFAANKEIVLKITSLFYRRCGSNFPIDKESRHVLYYLTKYLSKQCAALTNIITVEK